MENLQIYEKCKSVPENAKRNISGGRLNGKTDINPMWRIKKLTEFFGPCGIGWYYVPIRKWTENGANGEVAAFVDIEMYIKHGNEWSKPISGTGGAALIEKEKGGLHTNDEAYKMATTDAISVAAKQLGMGADVYWEKDSTKYDGTPPMPKPTAPKKAPLSKDLPVAEVKERSVKEIIEEVQKESIKLDDRSRIVHITRVLGFDDTDMQKVSEMVKKHSSNGKIDGLTDAQFFALIDEIREYAENKK